MDSGRSAGGGPEVVFGVEAAPGHQQASDRGGYDPRAFGGGGHCAATLGETLRIGQREGARIRFKSPARNLHGDAPRVRHLQLIAGKISGRKTTGSAAYASQSSNPSNRVVGSCDPATGRLDAEAWAGLRFYANPISAARAGSIHSSAGRSLPGCRPG